MRTSAGSASRCCRRKETRTIASQDARGAAPGAGVGSARKEDHIRLAAEQRRAPSARNDFDDVEFVHHALDGIDIADVDLGVTVDAWSWGSPIYINGMTGGSETAMRVNRTLAAAAAATGVPMASGSVGVALDDPGMAASFTVIREANPDGFVMANIGAGRPADAGRRAVELLGADALQLHLNAVQETVMPEGSRGFGDWLRGVEATAAECPVPVIVKEVGFGLSRRTLRRLHEIGVRVADVSGTGGTNFARIESARGDDAFAYLGDFGQSAASCLLDAPEPSPQLLASGGVRTPIDAVKALALGARAVGIAGPFLTSALEGDEDRMIAELRSWLDQIAMLLALLGAARPADLQRTDLLLRGRLREFAELRGVDAAAFSHRTDRIPSTDPEEH